MLLGTLSACDACPRAETITERAFQVVSVRAVKPPARIRTYVCGPVTGVTRPCAVHRWSAYHPRMDASADFMRFVTQAAEDAVTFDGDPVAIASAAQGGDKDAVANLTRAYAAIAVLMGIRLRPPWLQIPDAAQEAMLVLRRLIEEGSTTIAVDLPSTIEATFMGLRPPEGSKG